MKVVYDAYDRNGAAQSGVLQAASIADAGEILRKRGVFVTDLREAGSGGGSASERRAVAAAGGGAAPRRPLGGQRGKRLLMFSRQVHVLLRAGAPVVEALASAERQAKDPWWAWVIADVRDRVEQGQSMGEAMAHHGDAFDELVRSLVSAGESTGRLTDMMERVARLTERQVRLKNTLTSALVYPALLVLISVAVSTLMITFVVPRFEGLFTAMAHDLPPSTEVVMWLSHAIRGNAPAIIAGLAVLGVAGAFWWRTEHGRAVRDTVMVKAPLLGKVFRRLQAARAARLLGVLVESHVPLLEALKLVRGAMGNRHFEALIARAEESVQGGDPLSTAFENSPLAEGGLQEALRSGEESGDLASGLLSIADFMDEENDVLVRSVTSLIEPCILVGMGLVVGTIALSMFLPLFDMAGMV